MRSFPSISVFLFMALTSAIAKPDPAIAPDNSHVKVRGGLPNLAKTIAAGGDVHVAFLGGSITENNTGHTAMVPAWLESKFADSEISATNTGLSSTCSTTGAFRLSSHVFGKAPVDLLIVEFAVNDDQDAAHAFREAVRGMEGVVRKVRRDYPECDIVMVQFVNPGMLEKTQKGETPTTIAAHEKVAEHYGVTSVNVAAEIADAVATGRYTWKDYGGTHPGKFGYRVASNMIIAAIEAGMAKSSEAGAMPEPIDPGCYDEGKFIAINQAKRSDGWKVGEASRELLPVGSIRSNYKPMTLLRGDAPGDELSLEFEGRAVGAFVLAGPDAGKIVASVDGGDAVTHDLYHRHSGGLNYPRSVILASGLPPGKHTVTLRIAADKHPKSKGTTASILFFEVNG